MKKVSIQKIIPKLIEESKKLYDVRTKNIKHQYLNKRIFLKNETDNLNF